MEAELPVALVEWRVEKTDIYSSMTYFELGLLVAVAWRTAGTKPIRSCQTIGNFDLKSI
jgi:hypothetical protein